MGVRRDKAHTHNGQSKETEITPASCAAVYDC